MRTMLFFFFNDTATTEIYTLSLHDALPICRPAARRRMIGADRANRTGVPFDVRENGDDLVDVPGVDDDAWRDGDRKSTRLNSSHANISYAVFCLKKKKTPSRASAPS